jgi:hypothetical protein
MEKQRKKQKNRKQRNENEKSDFAKNIFSGKTQKRVVLFRENWRKIYENDFF